MRVNSSLRHDNIIIITARHSLSLIVVPYSHFLRGHRLAWSRIPTQLRYRPGALAVVGSNPTGPTVILLLY